MKYLKPVYTPYLREVCENLEKKKEVVIMKGTSCGTTTQQIDDNLYLLKNGKIQKGNS